MTGGQPKRLLLTAAMLGVFAALAAGADRRLQAAARPPHEPPIYLPQAEYLRPLSLGYELALADLLWFRTIDYFGRQFAGEREYPWLAYMCDLVTDLDPRNASVYRFAGMILPWEADRPRDGIRLLEKGVAELPESWFLRYVLGFTYYYFADDLERAQAEMAAAAKIPGAPPFVARLAALFHHKQASAATTVQMLDTMLRSTRDETVRRALIDARRQAAFSALAESLETEVRRFRDEFGWPPPTLETLLVAGRLREVPADPFGGFLYIDPATGSIRSSTGQTGLQFGESPRRRAYQRQREAAR